MIWVPKKEECAVWNETNKGIYIIYFFDGNDNKEFCIRFHWGKTPKLNGDETISYIMDYNPNYLSVDECMRDEVLKCPLNACSAKPQLRYNSIIDKWYCCCPSSAIGTKNDDQDEIDSGLIDKNHISYEDGYCNNPIEAIMKWNEDCAINYENIARNNIKKINEYLKIC